MIARRILVLPAATVLLLGVSACGSDGAEAGHGGHDGHGDGGSHASADTARHGKADVRFAKDMIPHHRQAVQMATMVDGKDVSPALSRLAAQVKAAQAPEIATMTGWLKTWGELVPDDAMSGHAMSGHEMPGMMSEADMKRLRAETGPAFERQWLTMMVEHHQGALRMARTEQDDGRYGPAKALAARIVAGQTKEIATMKRMLAGR